MRLVKRVAVVAASSAVLIAGTGGIAQAGTPSSRILKYGYQNANVGCVQHALNVIGRYYRGLLPYALKVDNIFGGRTKANVVVFQRWNAATPVHLVPDGIVGPKTRASLDGMIAITFANNYKTRDPELFRLYYGNCVYTGGAY